MFSAASTVTTTMTTLTTPTSAVPDGFAANAAGTVVL